MSKVSFIEVEEFEGKTVTHAVIEHEDGSFTTMPKAVYDSQVEHLTEIIPADEA